jgi:hypothetical protein
MPIFLKKIIAVIFGTKHLPSNWLEKKDKELSDTQLINWLEKITEDGVCPGIICDDFGHWAVSFEGVQNIPLKTPTNIHTTFFIEENQWHVSIREAIRYAKREHEKELNTK